MTIHLSFKEVYSLLDGTSYQKYGKCAWYLIFPLKQAWLLEPSYPFTYLRSIPFTYVLHSKEITFYEVLFYFTPTFVDNNLKYRPSINRAVPHHGQTEI